VGVYLFRKQAQVRQANFNSKIAELQLKALRAQMDPHFIFNALNSISHFLLKNQNETADFYLGKFAKLIRMILESSDQKLICLSQEIELLEAYTSIESMRLGKEINLNWKLPDGIDSDEISIPPMLLQPLVENSIWHGIAKIEGEGIITIQVDLSMDAVFITVSDNGPGIIPKSSLSVEGDSYHSMALKIVEERISLLGEKSSRAIKNSISWKSLNPGFQVELVLPDFSVT
jgi:LytS/YehU family sensor histidine kinase